MVWHIVCFYSYCLDDTYWLRILENFSMSRNLLTAMMDADLIGWVLQVIVHNVGFKRAILVLRFTI